MNFKQAYLTGFSLLLLATDVWARAGGGGGGGSYRGRGGRPMTNTDLAIDGLILTVVVGMAWYQKHRISEKRKRVSQTLQRIAVTERVWDEALLCDMIRKSFVQLQEAWSNQDVHLLQTLLYPTLFTDWFKQIDDMIAKGERNQVRNVIIRDLAIVDVQNYQNNDQDCFTVCVDASASDLTFNSVGEIVKDQTGAFREFWTYQWCDGAWRLIAVSQKDKWQLFVNAPIVDEGPSSGFKKAG